MHTHSLFTLLGERLMMHTNTVSITTYNTLYEVLFVLFFCSSSKLCGAFLLCQIEAECY